MYRLYLSYENKILTINKGANMGFDLYGINPRTERKRPERPVGMFEEDVPQPTKKEVEKYFEELNDFHEEVGAYFRNNVWWWRPLANYIIDFTGCVEKGDEEKWHENGGHEVDEETAIQIANQLEHLIKTGHTEKYAEEYMKEHEEANLHNEKIGEEMKKFQDEMDKKYNRDIAPSEYNQDDYKKWSAIYDKKKSIGNYPFNVNNVKEFIEFAKNSGGFRIC